MIFPGTKLICLDNSGAFTAKCIKVRNRFFGLNSDIIIITVKSHNNGKPKIRTHQIHRAIIVQSKSIIYRKINQYAKFSRNAIILLKKVDNVPIGSKIRGPVCFELRKKKFFRLIIMGLFVL